MSLRVRLIVVLFLLSVVPLGAMTVYSYISNARVVREAAGREATLLAEDLADRMQLVTAQLSQQFERLMELPSEPAVVSAAETTAEAAEAAPAPQAEAVPAGGAGSEQAAEQARIAAELGEVAMLLNNIDVRAPGRGRRGRSGPGDGGPTPDRGDDPAPAAGEPPTPTPETVDTGQIRIDLGPVRTELLRDLFGDSDRFDQLSPGERDRLLARVNERMLGIQQGIRILQQTAAEQAADAMAEAEAQAATAASPVAVAAAPAGPVQRTTELSGGRLGVRMERGGELVGEVNAEINMPNLLAAIFTVTDRARGEVPFAIDHEGLLYTPTAADRAQVEALLGRTPGQVSPTPPIPAPDAPGVAVAGNWLVVTTPDPGGSELTFGIARPLGEALDQLRRSLARNAGLGLAFIGLALIGIVPISSRLTRNLSRLSEGVDRIAAGDYRARVPVRSRDEVGTLAQAFNRMAEEVEGHQRLAVEQERLRRELELGRQIQHDMLPQAPLRLGLTEIRGISVPALEVGGDFFNYFRTSAGTIALIVGDVSGKGVGAALLMANIQASLRTRLALGQDLAALTAELDVDIQASTPGPVYATLFIGVLDLDSRELRYVNAGHHPQYALRVGGGLDRMDSTGLPIGLLAGRGYHERSLQLDAGDVLFFYTDGCVEAEDRQGEMLGAERLEAMLLAHPPAGSDVLDRIEQEIRAFRSGREPYDDATMMVVAVG